MDVDGKKPHNGKDKAQMEEGDAKPQYLLKSVLID